MPATRRKSRPSSRTAVQWPGGGFEPSWSAFATDKPPTTPREAVADRPTRNRAGWRQPRGRRCGAGRRRDEGTTWTQAPRRRGERRLRHDPTHICWGRPRRRARRPCSRALGRFRAVSRAAARCAARATASGADTTPRARPPGTLKTRLRSMSAALAKAVSTAPGSTVVTDDFLFFELVVQSVAEGP